MLQKINIPNYCCFFFYYLFLKNPKKRSCFPQKYYAAHWHYLLEWFLKGHVTLKTGIMVAMYSYYYQCQRLLCIIFLWKPWHSFSQDFLMNRKFKRTTFIWNKQIAQNKPSKTSFFSKRELLQRIPGNVHQKSRTDLLTIFGSILYLILTPSVVLLRDLDLLSF